MRKYEKLLLTILRGASDANISFSTLCTLLERLGFEQRIRGSHHIFIKEGIAEILNLQPLGSKANLIKLSKSATSSSNISWEPN